MIVAVGLTITLIATAFPLLHPVMEGETVYVISMGSSELLVSVPSMTKGNWESARLKSAVAVPPVAEGSVEVTCTSIWKSSGTETSVGLLIIMSTLSPLHTDGLLLPTTTEGTGSNVINWTFSVKLPEASATFHFLCIVP